MSGVPVRPGGFLLVLAVALAGAGSAAALVLAGESRAAGLAVALAGAALAAATRRATGQPRLLLLEAVSERLVEAAIFGAIAWVALPNEPRLASAAIIALGASYLAGYLRVRSLGLGFRVTEPGLFRAALLLLVAVGLLAGVVEITLWVGAALSASVLALEVVQVGRRREPR